MAYRRSVNPRFRERLAAEAEDYLDNDGIGMSSSSPSPSPSPAPAPSASSTPSSLATKAIRASSAHRDSSLSSAYSSPSSPRPSPSSSVPPIKNTKPYEYTSMKSLSEPKQSFWGTLARKAKAILDDDNLNQPSETTTAVHQTTSPYTPVKIQKDEETRKRIEPPSLTKGLDKITSSLNYIGGTIGNAVEEGLTVVENRTAGIIQETRKHIKKTPGSSATRKQQQPLTQNDLEIQLKASRDVSMAMAAKAKLLLRELKTVKADLAFAKQRCSQLEEENKALRENHSRGDNPEDDDLIRLQLETLVAEKARLAHENSIYARENRFLREVVEYHQLTMQDVVYLDEKTEEVTEVYPVKVTPLSNDTSYSGTPEFGNISSSSSSVRMKP